MKALNLTAQSGFINPQPIIAEIVELSGLDPAKVLIQPKPKGPEPVKVSIGSAEDIINPIMLATLMKTGQAPGPQELQAAIALILAAAQGPVPIMPTEPVDPNAMPAEVERPEMAHPGWESAPRLDRRAEDGGA
jgi:hypothetical protein